MGNDKYAAERGNPVGAQCGNYTLLFDAYYLKLHDGGKVLQAWHARSGKKTSVGMFDYSGGRQMMKGEGPIPEGEYWIQPKQMKTMWFSSDAWGGYRITIHPRPATITHGRGGFFVHGGKEFGSAGCIDLAWGMDSFALKLKAIAPAPPGLFDSNECYIPLTVKYAALSLAPP